MTLARAAPDLGTSPIQTYIYYQKNMHVHVFMMHPFAAKAIQGSDLKKSSILPVDGLFLPVFDQAYGHAC
eukprot:jgi/Botrbrau1/356/Bobra.110_2s0014.1